MKNRLIKHWITSVLGVISIGFGAYGLWIAKFDLTNALIFIGAGCVLLGIKDPFRK